MEIIDEIDEYDLKQMSPQKRLQSCKNIVENSNDESLRWDAVWIAGEIAEKAGPKDPLFDQVADLMAWVLKHDGNGVVKHEACYQISARKMHKLVPNLHQSALYDQNGLVKHEAIEALGLLNALDSQELLLKSLQSQNEDVKQTAEFAIKRLRKNQDLLV